MNAEHINTKMLEKEPVNVPLWGNCDEDIMIPSVTSCLAAAKADTLSTGDRGLTNDSSSNPLELRT